MNKPIGRSLLVKNAFKRFEFLMPNSCEGIIPIGGEKLRRSHLPIPSFGGNWRLLLNKKLNVNQISRKEIKEVK